MILAIIFLYISNSLCGEKVVDYPMYDFPLKIGMSWNEIVHGYGNSFQWFNRINRTCDMPGTLYSSGKRPYTDIDDILLDNHHEILFYRPECITVALVENKAIQIIFMRPFIEEIYGVKIGDAREVVEEILGKPDQEFKAFFTIKEENRIEYVGVWLDYNIEDKLLSLYINNDGVLDIIKITLNFKEIKKFLRIHYKDEFESLKKTEESLLKG